MGKQQYSPQEYLVAIAGCKESRKVGMCERKCSHWHPRSNSSPIFCKAAVDSRKVSRKHVSN